MNLGLQPITNSLHYSLSNRLLIIDKKVLPIPNRDVQIIQWFKKFDQCNPTHTVWVELSTYFEYIYFSFILFSTTSTNNVLILVNINSTYRNN